MLRAFMPPSSSSRSRCMLQASRRRVGRRSGRRSSSSRQPMGRAKASRRHSPAAVRRLHWEWTELGQRRTQLAAVALPRRLWALMLRRCTGLTTRRCD